VGLRGGRPASNAEARGKQKQALVPSHFPPPARPMHRWALAAVMLLAATTLPACTGVHVTIETTVRADGTVSRNVSFLREGGSSSSLKEEYRLPAGPAWTVTEEEVSDNALTPEERTAIGPKPAKIYLRYTAKRTYRPGHTVQPDYVKPLSSVPDRAASNSVTVERAPGLFGATFRYRETFTDVSEPEELVKLLRQFSRLKVARGVEALRKVHPEAAPWGAVEAKELEESESRLGDVLSVWKSITDEESRQTAERAGARYSDWIDALPERLSAVGGLNRNDVRALLEDQEKGNREDELIQAIDRHSGAHFGIFEGPFTFTLIVHMPGAILRSNADELRGRSTAVCRFTSDYFLMRPFTCEVESWTPTAF